jgi:hypothetical protein
MKVVIQLSLQVDCFKEKGTQLSKNKLDRKCDWEIEIHAGDAVLTTNSDNVNKSSVIQPKGTYHFKPPSRFVEQGAVKGDKRQNYIILAVFFSLLFSFL